MITRHTVEYRQEQHGFPTNAVMTLYEWKQRLTELALQYGEDALMSIDSGNNDAQMVIEVEMLSQ